MIAASATNTVTGLDAFDTRIARAALIPGIIAKYAQLIVETAQAYAPVETGGLRASIHAALSNAAAVISAGEGLPDARAILMEFGFYHAGSGTFVQHAYLRPAIEQHINAYLAEIRAALAR
ncbi:MAG: hypothetical protein M3Y41_17645 [Pseudomonadota bacterium]|nr:hypothetical protein [Pseudomonadota bacterium]